MNFGSGEIIVVLLVILVVFGGSQLPKLARNLGQASKELKKGMAEGAAENDDSEDSATA